MSDPGLLARRLLNQESVGVLSTHSVDVEGYPFGSIVSFILNYDGEPTILISDIAQHTRNIKHDKRVSLTVFDRRADDAQASSRLTWIGHAEGVHPGDTSIRHRYLRYFPSAESYFETHDFSFYRLRLVKGRFIGGFGQIFWLEPDGLPVKNPFRETEARIIEHMNHDNTQALLHYSKLLKGVEAGAVIMAGIDGEGFDLLVDGRKMRIDFESQISTVEEARAALVRLAQV